jgi:hypothetical protein
MYFAARDEIAAQQLADLCREAARQRLLGRLRAGRRKARHRRRGWEWLGVRRPRPVAVTATPANPALEPAAVACAPQAGARRPG